MVCRSHCCWIMNNNERPKILYLRKIGRYYIGKVEPKRPSYHATTHHMNGMLMFLGIIVAVCAIGALAFFIAIMVPNSLG